MSIDPYRQTDEAKPDAVDRVTRVLSTVSAGTTIALAATFGLIGLGLLVAGLVTSQPFLLPAGGLVLLLGVARALPLLLPRLLQRLRNR